jgi:hypothetical protein
VSNPKGGSRSARRSDPTPQPKNKLQMRCAVGITSPRPRALHRTGRAFPRGSSLEVSPPTDFDGIVPDNTDVPLLLDQKARARRSGIGFQPMRLVCSLARMPMPRFFPPAESPFAKGRWSNWRGKPRGNGRPARFPTDKTGGTPVPPAQTRDCGLRHNSNYWGGRGARAARGHHYDTVCAGRRRSAKSPPGRPRGSR